MTAFHCKRNFDYFAFSFITVINLKRIGTPSDHVVTISSSPIFLAIAEDEITQKVLDVANDNEDAEKPIRSSKKSSILGSK